MTGIAASNATTIPQKKCGRRVSWVRGAAGRTVLFKAHGSFRKKTAIVNWQQHAVDFATA
jgi:hypothetical protein